ncbi:MAG TPA: patatin-like phospholipase family protein, partial [Gemmatimonadales bacterium]|nr:patatin-like phospholipase family protein [Gemmatimonadales bacterium]
MTGSAFRVPSSAFRVTLVLSGGGVKSLAQIGAWKALQEKGLTPTHIVGTSMGAVVGAALAAGQTGPEFLARLRALSRPEVAPTDVLAFVKGIFAKSLLKPGVWAQTLAKLIPVSRFSDFKIPLTVTATDMDSGDLVFFGARGRDVPVNLGLAASCALPMYYQPVEIEGRRYADGGLRAVLPIEVARGIPADLIVAISVGPGFDEGPSKAKLPGLLKAHGDAERIMMAAQTERDLEDWPSDAAKLIVVRAVHERDATFAMDQVDR